MWVTIQCPSCQAVSQSTMSTGSYKGNWHCWKCRTIFLIEVEDGELISHQSITEPELEEAKAREKAEREGRPYVGTQASSEASVIPSLASSERSEASLESAKPKSNDSSKLFTKNDENERAIAFKVGDKVQIVSHAKGEYKGKLGKISYVGKSLMQGTDPLESNIDTLAQEKRFIIIMDDSTLLGDILDFQIRRVDEGV